jgi:hypothetical protein
MEQQIEKLIAQTIAKRIAKFIAMAIAGIIAITLFIFLGGKVVQLLWNWLMPILFGLREVTFWQAVGILALSRILFGGLGMGGNRGPRKHRFTLEEKERFRQRMRDRGGSPPAAPMWDDVEKPRNEPPRPATS